jgi:IclR family pca regulon transcriptional regulator
MGRVLLAGLGEQELADYLGRVRLEPHTGHTVRAVTQLRAELAAAAERGWALVDQELEEGLRGVAAPVRDRRGAVVAAVNVSVHAARITPQVIEQKYVPASLATAAAIEADIAGSP